MIKTISLLPGVVLRCMQDRRFKQGCLSVQMVRLMHADESAMNALLPSVLLRATKQYPDLRAITAQLDMLYGAAVGPIVRRIGDYQTVGLYCGFMEDRFALPGDQILGPMIDFVREVLLNCAVENGHFLPEIVESEKKNLIATIESERNDKRAYAMGCLLKNMCRNDSFGLPRLGEKEQVAAIDPKLLYDHYQKILRESPMEIFYVGSFDAEQVAALLKPIFESIDRCYVNLPAQTGYHMSESVHESESMDVAQGKLCMGFTTPITNRHEEFAAMQLFNTIFGAGMTSKLFMNIREKMSLCYQIGSGYHGSKGIVTVSAGIDFEKETVTRQEILTQLAACCNGEISDEELNAAKEAILSSLRATHDSPGAIEGYYATGALSGMGMTPAQYMEKVEQVTLSQVVAAANTVKLHSSFFLKGVST